MDELPKEKSGRYFRPLRPRILWQVVKAAGLLPITTVFGALFVVNSVVAWVFEPDIGTFGDAAWFTFAVVTTVGLGDFTCETAVGRLTTIVMSLYSIFYLALVTGAVVNYCSERLKAQRDESIAALVDKLERLPELSHEELVEISERVKNRA